MQKIVKKITQWASERNLIKGSTPIKQGLKLMSEYGELCDAIAKNDLEGIKDGIGDVGVVAIIIAAQRGEEAHTALLPSAEAHTEEVSVIMIAHNLMWLVISDYKPYLVFNALEKLAQGYGLTLEQCLEHAYSEIKDRKGIMHNGIFIKESDPRYPNIVKEIAE